MKYYLGQFIWDATIPEQPFWRSPNGCVGMVDLRTLPQQSKAGGAPEGFGFFASSIDLVEGTNFLLGEGDLRSLDIPTNIKSAWNTRLGYRPVGTTLNDVLFDML